MSERREWPILFSAPMIRAVLSGAKTQTRRLMNPAPPTPEQVRAMHGIGPGFYEEPRDPGVWRPTGSVWAVREVTGMSDPRWRCRYGVPGDHLWCREAWSVMNKDRTTVILHGHHKQPEDGLDIVYRATEDHGHRGWRPSIHLPRWASRLTLEVTDVRVQRLHEISGADAYAEGCSEHGPEKLGLAVHSFARVWREINGSDSWESNPWVWAISFRRVDAAAAVATEAA